MATESAKTMTEAGILKGWGTFLEEVSPLDWATAFPLGSRLRPTVSARSITKTFSEGWSGITLLSTCFRFPFSKEFVCSLVRLFSCSLVRLFADILIDVLNNAVRVLRVGLDPVRHDSNKDSLLFNDDSN